MDNAAIRAQGDERLLYVKLPFCAAAAGLPASDLAIKLVVKIRNHLRTSRLVHHYRPMTTTNFTVTGSDPTLPLGGLATNAQNTRDVLVALRIVRKMQASGLQMIDVVADGQSVPIGRLETSVNESINECIAKSTNKDLLKEYEHTRGGTRYPRKAPLLAELKRRGLTQ